MNDSSATDQPTRDTDSTAGEQLAIPPDMVDGYRDGFRGDPKPGSNRSHSYRHGWRVGMGDRSGAPILSAEQARNEAQLAILRDITAPPTS